MFLVDVEYLSPIRTDNPAKLRWKKSKLERKRATLEVMLCNNEREHDRLCMQKVNLDTMIGILETELERVQ